MKFFILLFAAIGLLMVTGCSTPKSVAKLEGQGKRHVFRAGYGPVWDAAKVAVEMDDLHIVNADQSTGYISVRRGMGVTTFGENVGIWVREKGPETTEVEVVSRPVGPPVFLPPHWEREILKTMAGILPS